jgi:hypothetical protein
MAGNGQFNLQIAGYPSGIDKTLRSIVLKGTVVPQIATTGVLNQITAFSITSNAATFTVNNSFTTGGGQTINVTGFTGTLFYLNGQYTSTSATSTTLVVPLTHSNVATTAAYGIATVAPTYQTGGLPISLAFINFEGKTQTVGDLGPLSTIKWFDAESIAGSAYNYKVNLTGTTPLLLVYNGVTQATDASTLPFDTVGFRAEFTFGAF